MSDASTQPSSVSTRNSIGWAFFLGVSWTWCIGMFLPVILVREFGALGWIVFAMPNVIGAAAMGWVLRDPDSSRRIVEQHRSMCAVFSLVTILFQLYFAGWMAGALAGPAARIGVLVLAAIGYAIGRMRAKNDSLVSIGVWVISLVLLTTFFVIQPPQVASLRSELTTPIDLLGLTLVCLLGFAACPYLDLTFHRARQNCTTPRESKLAFGVGFGGVFFTMIIGSLLYARQIPSAQTTLAFLLASHWVMQMVFTIGVHHHEIRENGTPLVRLAEFFLVLAAAGWLCTTFGVPGGEYHGITFGELGYRFFMSFYGLIFPAYVWLAMVPRRGQPSRRAINVLVLLTILAALPCYWLGFIERQYVWLIPGVLIVTLARWFPLPQKAIDNPASHSTM